MQPIFVETPKVKCPECGHWVYKAALKKHLRTHPTKKSTRVARDGEAKLKVRKIFGYERCECGQGVVLVGASSADVRVHDVLGSGGVGPSHSCSGLRSESLHTLRGGIVDSNRRHH